MNGKMEWGEKLAKNASEALLGWNFRGLPIMINGLIFNIKLFDIRFCVQIRLSKVPNWHYQNYEINLQRMLLWSGFKALK